MQTILQRRWEYPELKHISFSTGRIFLQLKLIKGTYTTGFDPKTGKMQRRSVYGKTQKEVRQALAKVTSEIDEGKYVTPTKTTFSKWLDIWIADYTMNLKPATRAIYMQHIRVHLKPYVGDIVLTQLSTADIQQLYSLLLNELELSPKTVKNVHGVLHRALEQAKKIGYIRTNPADAAITPRVEKKQVEAMESDDISVFLKAIQGTKYEYPMFVAVFTGLRQGELLGLTWDCVDFKNGMLLINKQHNRTKGEKEFRFSALKNDKLSESETDCDIGIWGRKHLNFLKENRYIRYTILMLNGTLGTYLTELNHQAKERFDLLIAQMAKAQGVNERLKARDQMAWVGAMNNIYSAATEIVDQELIFV